MEDIHIYAWKKRLFIATIIFLNILFSLIVYFNQNVKWISIIYVILKSKDILCVVIIIGHTLLKQLFPKKILNEKPINVVVQISLYNEPFDEIRKTLNALNKQQLNQSTNILICLVCDRPFAFHREIFGDTDNFSQKKRIKYFSWKQQEIDITLSYQKPQHTKQYKFPIVVLEKSINMGKRCSLVLINDIFNNHIRKNIEQQQQLTVFNLKNKILDILKLNYDMDRFDYAYYTDCDCILNETGLQILIDNAVRKDKTCSCSIVMVDFDNKDYGFWNIYQNFQYAYGQMIRRSVESISGRLICLPGASTLIKLNTEYDINETNYVERYTDIPKRSNFILSNIQFLGTDRRLTSCIMQENKSYEMYFDPNSVVYTAPPQTYSEFIGQRRRWSSNMYFNTLNNMFSKNILLKTKILGFFDLFRQSFLYFRFFIMVLFIKYLIFELKREDIIYVIPFMVIISTPYIYFMVFQGLYYKHLRERYAQLLIGMVLNKILTPFLQLIIFTNMFSKLGNFRWTGVQKEEIVIQNKLSIATGTEATPTGRSIADIETPLSVPHFSDNTFNRFERFNNQYDQHYTLNLNPLYNINEINEEEIYYLSSDSEV